MHSAVRLLKVGVHLVLGWLGYRLVKLPKNRTVLPLDVESKNRSSPDSADAVAPCAVEVAAIRELKQKAFAVQRLVDAEGVRDASVVERVKKLEEIDSSQALVHLQHQYRQSLKLDEPAIRIIGGDWLRNIGQIAHLDCYFKLKALKMVEASETIICLDGGTPVNQSLLSYYAPYARWVVPNKAMLGDLAEYAELLEESTTTVRLADGTARHYHSLFFDVAVAWEQQARPPLVSLRAAHRVKGRRWLSSLGLPDDGWFVTFHCRTTIGHQDARSVRTETYLPAMEAVVRAGGWVVCMGSEYQFSHPRIISREGCRSPQDDWKDVFLVADCRFFVGCTSGPADVACAFGVPSVKTNMTDISKQAACYHDLFIPKLFQSRQLGRPLTMAEILASVNAACGMETAHMTAVGLDVIDNTPEEIEAVVCEMMERLAGMVSDIAPWDEAAQQRLRELRQPTAVGPGPIMAGKPRMGRDFLRRNAAVLGLGSPEVS